MAQDMYEGRGVAGYRRVLLKFRRFENQGRAYAPKEPRQGSRSRGVLRHGQKGLQRTQLTCLATTQMGFVLEPIAGESPQMQEFSVLRKSRVMAHVSKKVVMHGFRNWVIHYGPNYFLHIPGISSDRKPGLGGVQEYVGPGMVRLLGLCCAVCVGFRRLHGRIR